MTQRLDYYDPKPPEPEAAPVVTEVAAPVEAQPEAVTDTPAEAAAELTPEDLALIEAQPDGEESVEADKSDKADEPAEGEATEDEAEADGEGTEETAAVVPTLRPPEGASEEELAAWRKAAGVPATADEYEPGEVDGHEWGPDDEPALQAFHEAVHALNISKDSAAGITSWYAEQMKVAHARDVAMTKTARDELSQEWGDDFAPNMKAFKSLFAEGSPLPPDVAAALKNARTKTGERLVNLPGFVRLMVGLASSETARTLTPEAARAAEMAELQQLMDTNIDAYQSGTWRTTGKAPWARALELSRAAEADGKKPSAPIETVSGLRAELADIEKLMNTDIHKYMNETYRGSGKTASQRSLEIQRQLAGQRAA